MGESSDWAEFGVTQDIHADKKPLDELEKKARERMEFMDLPWTLGESEKAGLAGEFAAFAREQVRAKLEAAANYVESKICMCEGCKKAAAQRIREMVEGV